MATRNRTQKAFTLIELLVVISIIALLLAILIPSLQRARTVARRTICVNNLKSLALTLHVYAQSFSDRVPSALTYNVVTATNPARPLWVDHTPLGTGVNNYQRYWNERAQTIGIERGVLWPFVDKGMGIYQCPDARLLPQMSQLGNLQAGKEVRNYVMSAAFGDRGVSDDSAPESSLIDRLASVRNPVGRMAFTCESPITPSGWYIYYGSERWRDTPSVRHGDTGCTMSFVDGHAEYVQWKDPRTITLAKRVAARREADPASAAGDFETHEGSEDIAWAQRAVWGRAVRGAR